MRADKRQEGESTEVSAPQKVSPTPREEPKSESVAAPTRPMVDSAASSPILVEAPAEERRPQRREGNLADAKGVRVIRTTTRDLRRDEREAREAEERRLAEAGSTGGARRSRTRDQGATVRGASQESRERPDGVNGAAASWRDRGTPIHRRGATSPGEQAVASENVHGASRQATKREKRAEVSPRKSGSDVVEGARGAGAGFVEYVRTHTRLVVVLCAVIVALVSLYGPVRDYYVAWRKQGVLEAQYQEVSTDNQNLESDVDRLQSREGVEDEARRQGYSYEGENTLSVEGVDDDPNQGSSPLDSSDNTSQQDVPWYVHVADVIFFYSGDSQG